ncbi:MAG: hypothetical protein K2W96_02605 [Gemmataceae bacterium]|nr:hypothetical protein [Gemmataceae bacterium]
MKKAVIAFVVFAGLAASARASDATEYRAFAIYNDTGRAMTYQVRWGSGAWKAHTLPAGKGHTHSYTDFDDSPAPFPQVAFAATPGAGWSLHNPDTDKVTDKRNAPRQSFRIDGYGRVSIGRR